MQVLKSTSRRTTNIKKMVCHITLYFPSIYITFVNSKSFFKASGRPNILFTTTFAGYQINNISTATLQNHLDFIFPLGSKASKVRMQLKTQKSRRSKRRNHNQKRKTIHKKYKKLVTKLAKALCPDQNAINLRAQELTDAEKFLLRKGSSFILNSTDITWLDLKSDFDNFVNKFRYMATKPNDENKKK